MDGAGGNKTGVESFGAGNCWKISARKIENI